MSGVRPRAAGKFRTRTPMSGYLVSGRHGSEAERSDGSGKWSEAVCMVRMGLFARACPKRRSYGCAIGLGSLLRIAGCLSFRIRSAYRCGAFCPCDGTREEARPSVGHVPPAGLFRPDSSARTFSPDAPLRTFLSYSFRRSFCIRFSRSIAIPETNPCRGFSFCPFFRIFA